jgi:hypothetical protein
MPSTPRDMVFLEADSLEWCAWAAAGYYAGYFRDPGGRGVGWEFPSRWPPKSQMPPEREIDPSRIRVVEWRKGRPVALHPIKGSSYVDHQIDSYEYRRWREAGWYCGHNQGKWPFPYQWPPYRADEWIKASHSAEVEKTEASKDKVDALAAEIHEAAAGSRESEIPGTWTTARAEARLAASKPLQAEPEPYRKKIAADLERLMRTPSQWDPS